MVHKEGDIGMGFQEAIRTCLKEKYVTFSGRAARSEYWYFYLFVLLATFALVIVLGLFFGIVYAALGEGAATGGFLILLFILFGVGMIALYIPLVCAQVRRLHDRELSGWWILASILVGLVPFVGQVVGFIASIALLVFTILKGTDGGNKYGEDPLNPTSAADVFS
jgi:uncharacterized membrane protein YhaH (DUF805 family)